MEYTPEQQSDYEERGTKAISMLKELELIPSANVIAANTGDDVFAFKVQPFLKDGKDYSVTPATTPVEPTDAPTIDAVIAQPQA